MADYKGFIKYKKALPGTEAPKKRVAHFKEFYVPKKETFITQQAARCMDCGIPFCHSACPLGNLIPDFNDAVYKEDWKLAFEVLMATNNFPEFTGRICPAPCEGSCVLGLDNSPVSIEYVEKSIIEKAFESGWVQPRIPSQKSGKKVAVIGSGPAGLACADDLNQAGHEVVVFEKNTKPGGLLRYGIPDFKLQKDVVQRRIGVMQQEGVVFKTGVNVGVDIEPSELVKYYDAVVLAGGSEHPRDLPVEGRAFNGIHFAMEFLKQSNEMVSGAISKKDLAINVKGKKVLIIGGGDTGSDCIGNSNRQGAESITQLEILGKPPVDRAENNPWPQWPMVLKTSTSHEEGCEREWAVMTKRFLSNDGKNVSGVEVVEVEWAKGKNGRSYPKEIEGTLRTIECDAVFLAMGFLHPQKEGLLEKLGVALSDRGNVDAQNYKTSVDKIFAAGDMRRGQSLVVWAISEGKSCAEEVDIYLGQD